MNKNKKINFYLFYYYKSSDFKINFIYIMHICIFLKYIIRFLAMFLAFNKN